MWCVCVCVCVCVRTGGRGGPPHAEARGVPRRALLCLSRAACRLAGGHTPRWQKLAKSFYKKGKFDISKV
jgi:hypothetical protein